MEATYVYALLFVAALCFGGTLYAGIIIERVRWNRLIEDGILPRPRRKR
jgi:hypothetical protein